MGSDPKTLQEAIVYFSDFDRCQQFMIDLRWPDGKVRCPYCGADKVTYLKAARVWKCYGNHPRPKFSLKVGTLFEDSPISLDKWFCAMWLVDNCKNGISSHEIARDLGVTQKSAWFMLHRIRLAMQTKSFDRMMSGEVEADESFFGGKAKNMHLLKRIRKQVQGELAHGGATGKAVVMGLLERNSKQVRVKVLPELRKRHIDDHMREHVVEGSTLYTDEAQHYENLPDYAHEFVNHTEAYVKGRVHTNGLENYWSLLKRCINGTYVSVEPFHLQAYVDEQAMRFNTRELTEFQRFKLTLSQIVGKRLTYAELTGKFA
jgi:transposase-like protein